MTPEGCTCGCGKDRATAIREIARHEMLNEEQAEARLDAANATRAEAAEWQEPPRGPGRTENGGYS